MTPKEPIILNRDCTAIQIPNGTEVTLPKGTQVQLIQSLGDNFTISTHDQVMYQITGKNADAIGLEVPQSTEENHTNKPLEERIWDQLKTCYDPEIPVNIVDLGLIYDCSVTPLPNNKYLADVKMTLTAQGCGMGASIAEDAKHKILSLDEVSEAQVNVVWDPPWNPSMMSLDAQKQLGLI